MYFIYHNSMIHHRLSVYCLENMDVYISISFISRISFIIVCLLLEKRIYTSVSRPVCQKCRWQVTAKHAYTLSVWLCMKWHAACLYGVHITCAETAAVSCGTSHASAVSTPLRYKKLVTHVESPASAVSLLKRTENSAV